jgi:hypothetical protein
LQASVFVVVGVWVWVGGRLGAYPMSGLYWGRLQPCLREVDNRQKWVGGWMGIERDREIFTDRQTDKQTDRQTGRQADRQTDRQTGRQTDSQNILLGWNCLAATNTLAYSGTSLVLL